MVALKVRCRSGRSRAPPVRSFRRLVSLCSIDLGGSTVILAAASSMARGRPSSLTQISATAGGALVGYGEVGLYGSRPLHEEPHHLILGQPFQGRWALEVRQSEGRDRKHMLAVES
jgi:hypothetical protein